MQDNFEKLTQEWNDKLKKTMKYIENSLNFVPKNEDEENLKKFLHWIVNTNIPVYQFAPEYANAKETPQELEALFGVIKHALLDDGEMYFVNVKFNGKTKFLFLTECYDYSDNAIEKKFMDIYGKEVEQHKSVRNRMRENLLKHGKDVSDFGEISITIEHHHDPVLFMKEAEQFEMDLKERTKRVTELLNNKGKLKP